jgi:hypothetical protein
MHAGLTLLQAFMHTHTPPPPLMSLCMWCQVCAGEVEALRALSVQQATDIKYVRPLGP